MHERRAEKERRGHAIKIIHAKNYHLHAIALCQLVGEFRGISQDMHPKCKTYFKHCSSRRTLDATWMRARVNE